MGAFWAFIKDCGSFVYTSKLHGVKIKRGVLTTWTRLINGCVFVFTTNSTLY